MATLKYLLKGIMSHNRDGSFSTQADRKHILIQSAKQLKEGGFTQLKPDSLKPKHVTYLIERWQKEGLAAGTIKGRMSHIRWWAEKVGKSAMIPKSNTGSNANMSLNLEKRSHIPTVSKGKELDLDKLDKIPSRHIQLSLRLQKEFGLRREECIKFKPSFAIRGDKLSLVASTTKGGRPRDIPILTDSQRALLVEVKALTGNGSLIPAEKSFIQQLKIYENQTAQAGLDKNHGLRHRYAQDRYETLTGWKCPVEGGTPQKDLTPEQREVDKVIRLQISEELGHSRLQIVASYIGT